MKSLAGFFVFLTGASVASVLHLAFYVPGTVKVWAAEGRALSQVQIMAVNASAFCVDNWWYVLPVFGIAFLASVIWLIRACRA